MELTEFVDEGRGQNVGARTADLRSLDERALQRERDALDLRCREFVYAVPRGLTS